MRERSISLFREAIFDKEFLGGYSEGGTPVPIPNTEAKSFCADGTALTRGGRVGRRRDFSFLPHTTMSCLPLKTAVPDVLFIKTR